MRITAHATFRLNRTISFVFSIVEKTYRNSIRLLVAGVAAPLPISNVWRKLYPATSTDHELSFTSLGKSTSDTTKATAGGCPLPLITENSIAATCHGRMGRPAPSTMRASNTIREPFVLVKQV